MLPLPRSPLSLHHHHRALQPTPLSLSTKSTQENPLVRLSKRPRVVLGINHQNVVQLAQIMHVPHTVLLRRPAQPLDPFLTSYAPSVASSAIAPAAYAPTVYGPSAREHRPHHRYPVVGLKKRGVEFIEDVAPATPTASSPPTMLSDAPPATPVLKIVQLPSQIPFGSPEVALDPALQYGHHSARLNIDLTSSWATIQKCVHSSLLNAPATHPALPSLAIVDEDSHWPVIVQRSGTAEYVRIGDVLYQLWLSLQAPLPSGIVRAPGLVFHKNPAVSTEENGRARRVELLHSRTCFAGLSATQERDTFLMRFA
ncbi:hypothetical protein CYLTODRAFT_420923 [Cylindrobasidium torrendii FP15055 ss-10]|uniref:DUF6699 domain-containing protein n=1 Tax=Cylindrobasidium torrendii FP15055 ss-10 TaxID=1314674 RepID=A0A0D7BFD3_9AGAR|nr:hypothetical protein CYLTODRAFT_420923 [Cylindrobasidium torrendii FP15055 ss-10]